VASNVIRFEPDRTKDFDELESSAADAFDALFEKTLDVWRTVVRRGADDAPLRDQSAPLLPEALVLVEHAREVIGDMFFLAATIVERKVPPEQMEALREWIQHCYARRFDLDPTSERHARVALVGLINIAISELMTHGKPGVPPTSEWAEGELDHLASWVLKSYADDFPDYAAKLVAPEKRRLLRLAIAAWFAAAHGGLSHAGKYRALAKLGARVFLSNKWDDWKNNIWLNRDLRRRVTEE
jgi:hypothetical protein